MFPLIVSEQLGTPVTPLVDRIARGAPITTRAGHPNLRDYLEMALRGGFPHPSLMLGDRARRSWLDTYVEEIVTRDARLAGCCCFDDAGQWHRRGSEVRGGPPPRRPRISPRTPSPLAGRRRATRAATPACALRGYAPPNRRADSERRAASRPSHPPVASASQSAHSNPQAEPVPRRSGMIG